MVASSLSLRLACALFIAVSGACASSPGVTVGSKPASPLPAATELEAQEPRCSAEDPLACPPLCLAGHASACTYLGRAGVDTPGANPSETLQWLRRACELSDAEACTLLASFAILFPELAGPTETLLRRACEANHGPSCLSMGLVLESKDAPERAALFYERGCELGAPRACFNLGVMHHQGIGVPKRPERAMVLYERACEHGEPVACSDLAVMLREGQGGAADDVRAVSLFESACERGVHAACYNLGLHCEEGRGTEKNGGRAALLYERACEAGIAASCVNLGAMFESGDGVQKNRSRARERYQQACDAGLQVACELLSPAP